VLIVKVAELWPPDTWMEVAPSCAAELSALIVTETPPGSTGPEKIKNPVTGVPPDPVSAADPGPALP